MKKLITLLIFLVLLLALSPKASAADVEARQRAALGTEKLESSLPDDASEILRGVSASDCSDYKEALSSLGEKLGENAPAIISSGLKSAAMLITASVLAGFAASAAEASHAGAVSSCVPFVGVLTVMLISASDLNTFIGLGKTVTDEIGTFSKALLPTLSAAAAASGAVTSAAAKCAAAMLLTDLAVSVCGGVVLPLVYAYLASCAAEAAFGGKALSGVSRLLKWLAVTVMTVTVLAFVIYLTVSGVISSAADAAALRMTKTAMGMALPVVGGILSDAAGAVLNGASLLKSSIGVFGMLSVLAICLLPFARLSWQYLCYKLAAGISGAAADERTAGFIGSVGSAFGLVTGMTGACSLMVFLSVISLMTAVTA